MKTSTSWFKKLVLLTTMLFTPAIAAAQEAQDQSAETYAEDEEIVVLGVNIPEPMRETSEVATFLSAEDLARTGDDTAAAALTRLTGLSVVSNRFVYVRGLGDRYSSALLNGSPLPSPEPLRRQVPLDLFPSNILDGATVQKTFSPNYPGEFGGGIIDLNTLRMPRDPFFTIKFGTAYNAESTGQEGLTYYGEPSDWSTVSDGLRDIPGALADAISQNVRIDDTNFTDAELEQIGESLTNSPLTVIQSEEMDPDFEGEVTAGTSFDLGRFNIGLVGVAGYDSTMRGRTSERAVVVAGADDSASVGRDITSRTGSWDIVANALGTASLGWDENEISLTGLLVRSSTKYAQISQGFNENFTGGDRYDESTAWYERQLASIQLRGEHTFGALGIDWRMAFAESTRDAPYERSITYVLPSGGGDPAFAYANGTRFSELTDEVASGGVDVTYTLPLSAQRDAVFAAGVSRSQTDRQYESILLAFETSPATPVEVLLLRPDYLFSPDNIHPDRFEIREDAGLDRNYLGTLDIDAAYASVDIELMPLLRAAVGVRHEEASQVVDTYVRYTAAGAPTTTLENSYWLPAATLTWNFADDLQMRFGYSQTIARPQFRELAFTPYLDPDTDREFIGNPYLTDSELRNYDARVEYYFDTNQFITFGLFYKQIDRPIEEVVVTQDGTTTQTRFINAPEATLYGAEIDYRVNFDLPFNVPFFGAPGAFFGANYTYTSSEVSADGTVISPNTPETPNVRPATEFVADGSPLQGTPEHIANLQFGIENDSTQLTVLLGYVSERVLMRGTPSGAGVPTVFEDPGTNLDIVLRHDFQVMGSNLTLGVAGRNLLDQAHEEYQETAIGRTEFNTYDRGQSFSLSLTAKY
jgi:outer membrane receptor protein involved in Fe transport